MIYIFAPVRELASLLARVCRACKAASCRSTLQRPFGFLVLIGGLLGCGIFACCIAAKFQPSAASCIMNGAPVELATWLDVQALFGLVGAAFAPYVQCRLVQKVVEAASMSAAAPKGPRTATARDVHNIFRAHLGFKL
eukprot:TRINITY_DN28222_c0_g1_i1.p2 TRINITY_DN28222_c0_g1~~TRINITY_DN28222_c0_g1_i1.p2  ORF type:complete len:138 (+),score=37.72 TRINITY_DN28222_c0_g1_i1:70-483(+)